MPVFRFVLEYDGTDFAGWQRQREGERTVQGVLEDALARVVGVRAAVIGAGRTDAGVHAEGQVASAELETVLAPETLARALNARLPCDVAVLEATLAPPGFHARYDARAKVYRYSIWNSRQPSPLRQRRFLTVRAPLDVEAMREAAQHLAGCHDFACFETRPEPAAGRAGRSTVRRLDRVELSGSAGGEIQLELEGSGFLRHMVRAIAGTLLEVGRARRAPESLPGLLAGRDRREAGPTAPARGLTLVRLRY